MHLRQWAALALSGVFLAGCAQAPVGRGPAYPQYPAQYPSQYPPQAPQPGYGWGAQPQPPQQQPAYAQVGHVTDIRRVGSETSGGGAVIGGVVGAVVGRQFGGSTSARNAGTVLGAVGGALIGNQIERGQQGGNGAIRVSVQFDDGSARAFDYAELGDLHVGDRVRLQNGQLYRY